VAQTVKITPASGLLEFIGNTTSNKPYLQHDDNGNLTLTLQATKKFTVAGNLKVNGKVTMAQQTLTDGAAITWDFNSGANAKVTLAGARTLVLSNMETGDTGLILVKQDAAGSRTLTLPGSSSIVGGGTYTASPAANATDVLGVYYDGTTYWWTIGYNTVTPPITSIGITGADFTIANSPLTANGNIGLALATVNSNVGQFGSATAVPVITVNAKGLVTAVSATNISIPTNLDSLTDVTITSAATNQLLQFNGSQWVNWTPNYITSYTETDPTVPSHVKSITTTEKSNWNTAYGWGNHATAGYLTSVTNISGYAGTLIREDNRTISPSELTAGQMKFGFTSWNNDNLSPYADFIHMRSYTDSSGGTDNLIMFKKSGIGMRIWQQTWGSTSPYSSYVDAWTTGNFTQTDVNNWNTAYGWGNHATQGYATQTYVNTAVSNLVASSPAALDTLNELAAALGNDASFSTTVSTALGNRLRVDINTQGLTATQKGYGRTNLGVVIGTDVQAWDGDLDAIAALAATSGFLKKTAANTWSLDTNTYITGNQTITLSGDITGSGTTSISTALSNTGVTASTYKSVTVDAKGRVTAGSNPTTLAGYGITNAVTYGDYITQSVFSGKTITVNPVIIKELLFGGSNRYTQTDSYTGTYPNAGSTWVRTYRLNNGENAVYSSGNVYLGFWVNYPPANVTVRVRNTSGVYYGPFTGSDISITGQFAFWKIPCGGANFIDTWEITFTPQAGLGVNLQTVNIAIDNGEGIDQFPIVHRDGSTMYGRLNFMSGGSVRAYVDPSGAIYGSGNFTANSFVKAGGTSTQFLKADGSVDSSSYITLTSLSGSTGISYNNTTGAISSTITQYTDALARAAHSFTAGSGAYNATTGVITIPTNNNQLTNGAGYITQATANPLYVNVTGDTMTGPLVITGSTSGQELFAVNGVNGRLFTVSDDLSNSLFSVNTVAGLPVIEAFANNTVNIGPFSAPIVINASGISTPSHGTSANWNSAYNDTITSAAVSGTTSKTLTLTQRDGGTVTATWTDIDTDTNTDAQTLSLSGNTLSISGGNSVTLASTGISQATADGLYVNISGDEMTGNLYISPISANPAQIQLAGSNPELYVSAKTGTARVFISRQGTGNQATLMFMTAMGAYQGTAWDYTGAPMWSMGMTNNANTNSFKLGYGDIYDPTVVALEITTANTAYFKYVPYAAGNLLATQSWVTSQGYITSYSETDTLNSVTGRGASTTNNITIGGLTSNGVGVFNSTNDTQISLRSTNTWSGIEFDDSGTPDYIWYNGGNQTFAIGGGGSNVSGKKLHVHGGVTIGSNYAATSVTTNGLAVEGAISASNFSGSSSGTNTGDQTNISGNAATAGYSDEAKWISFLDGPRDLSDRLPNWNNRSVAWDFVGAGIANGSGNYGGVMTFSPWDGTSGSTGDSSYQLAFANNTGVNASGQPKLSIRNGINSTWNAWYTLIHSGNIGSQTVATAGALTSMNISQFTNNSGYLTSITSGNVTTALGYTPWHAGNDGAGSGLDADLLDGYTSDTAANVNTIVRRDSSGNIYSNYVLGSYFNASAGNSANPTIGQIWTQDTSDNYLRKSTPGHFRSQVTDSYYLSLSGGTLSGNLNMIGELAFRDGAGGYSNIIRAAAYPSEGFAAGSNYWLEYQSRGGHHFVLNTDGGVGGGANTMDDFVIWQGAIDGDRLLEVSNTGTLTIANRLIELSSIRYKTQVESLTPALDKVLQLRPVHYVKIGGTGETEIGLIAEEVAEIYPELVKYDSEGQVDGINYTRIAPILIKTIQEQHEIIKKLTERIENLENR
jgi:hypothetical protein